MKIPGELADGRGQEVNVPTVIFDMMTVFQ